MINFSLKFCCSSFLRFWKIPTPGAKVLELSYEAYQCYLAGIIEIIAGTLLTISGISTILINNDIDIIPITIPVQIPSAILGKNTKTLCYSILHNVLIFVYKLTLKHRYTYNMCYTI